MREVILCLLNKEYNYMCIAWLGFKDNVRRLSVVEKDTFQK